MSSAVLHGGLRHRGGVYDNVGDEWFAGYADRRRAWPGLPDVCAAVDELVIVNSSGGWGWQPVKGWSLLRREVYGALASKNVLYNSSTRIRRRDLIETFRAHEVARRGHVGALVHMRLTCRGTASTVAATISIDRFC